MYEKLEDVPKMTELGFKKMRCPSDIWEVIKSAYFELKPKEKEEFFSNKKDVIKMGKSTIMPIDSLPGVSEKIKEMFLPYAEDFSGRELTPKYVYGIRSYKKYSTLIIHTDRADTHHIGIIVMLDKDLRCGCAHREMGDDWPLDFKDNKGNWHQIYMRTGDVLLYESATCEHGRKLGFQGEFYTNFYVHYQLKN